MRTISFFKYAVMAAVIAAGLSFFASCEEDENNENGDDNGQDKNVVVVTENITSSATWHKDTVYQLAGRITVTAGNTLTIQPGTIIKGEEGTGADATALLVARDAKIMAEGTADAPIIFTSVGDSISPEDVAAGKFASPNLEPNVNGLWGGVIVLGNAPISASNDQGDVSEVQIEGIPTSDPNGLYGGDDDQDNSGVLKYISIRHGGANIGAGNEINGLTLGGIGTGTTVEHVEVVSNQDDGVEWFGGTVNVKNVLIWNSGDDGLDTDQAWNGTVEDFIIMTPGGSLFELDGPEGTYINGRHTMQNGIAYAGDLGEELVDFDKPTNVDLKDVYFFGIADNGIKVEQYAAMADTAQAGSFTNIEYTLADGVSMDSVFVDVPEANLTEVAKNENTVGPAAGSFSWTWASQAGALEEIGL